MGRRLGDRWDGTLIRDIDSMHFIMPLIYPNRCDNEAFVMETVDLTKLSDFLNKKNADNPEYKYNMFQVIVTAILKTVTLRPKMNRFIANKNIYQRNDVSASFVVKKQFSDNGGEALCFLHAKDDDTIDTVHEQMKKKVTACKSEDEVDASTGAMDALNKLPRFLGKFIVWLFYCVEKRGWVPKSLVATDPYYASVILSNLGSIKLCSGYHHLTNWGTTSVFLVIGERKVRPFVDEEGNTTYRDSVKLGITVDERIADGYYFSKTVRLLKKLIENPELLEMPLSQEVEY